MNFEQVKYQHIERWGTGKVKYLSECESLTVMPKIDGTNAVVHYDADTHTIKTGSRNRWIVVDDDNEGFAKYITEHVDNYLKLFSELNYDRAHTDIILYGEYTKKSHYTVEKEYLHEFYCFDVLFVNTVNNTQEYVNPNEYSEIFEKFDIKVVPSETIKVSEMDSCLERFKEFSKFLLPSDFEHGEGLVLKDYNNSHNVFGNTVWAKILYDKPPKKCVIHDVYEAVEQEWFNDAYLDKETEKYYEKHGNEKFNLNKYCNIMSYNFMDEELVNIMRKYKPVLDYSKFNTMLILKARRYWLERHAIDDEESLKNG